MLDKQYANFTVDTATNSPLSFSESDFSWTREAFIVGGCLAVGYAYRNEKQKRSWANVGIVGEILRYLLNTHNWNLANNAKFLHNDEYIRMPLYHLQQQMKKPISRFVWRQFLNFCEQHNLIEVKRMLTHGINHIRIKFLNLRDFIIKQLNRWAKNINGNIVFTHNDRFAFERYSSEKTLTAIDLPDDFTHDEIVLFEEFLKIRAEIHHLNNSPQEQQKLLDRLQELQKDNCDRKEVMRRAIYGKWVQFYHLSKEEPRIYPKKRKQNGFHSMGSLIQRE